jgi:hypothetical protein
MLLVGSGKKQRIESFLSDHLDFTEARELYFIRICKEDPIP